MEQQRSFTRLILQSLDLFPEMFREEEKQLIALLFVAMRRFDCVLTETKAEVLAKVASYGDSQVIGSAQEDELNQITGKNYHNRSSLDFDKLKAASADIERNLLAYIDGFSRELREVFEWLELPFQIQRLNKEKVLYGLFLRFERLDLSPAHVSCEEILTIFSDLIAQGGRDILKSGRRFWGEFLTPQDIAQLMVQLVFFGEDAILEKLTEPCRVIDPTCGMGNLLVEASRYMAEYHRNVDILTEGQEVSDKAAGLARLQLYLREQKGKVYCENVFEAEPLCNAEYMLCHPPFRINWKRTEKIMMEHHLGFEGRFGASIPRINDGSLLFLQHLIHKFKPGSHDGSGSRLCLLFPMGPLFVGSAASGESQIRRWVIENDWLETIVALPSGTLFQTSIPPYLLIITNRKSAKRKGAVQLIDASNFFEKDSGLRRSAKLGTDHLEKIARLYDDFNNEGVSKIFKNEDFGYWEVTVERPLRLAYQMTVERKRVFLNAYPRLLDDLQDIDQTFGRESQLDWNKAWASIDGFLREKGRNWDAKEMKLFRKVFTDVDALAEPVLLSDDQGFEGDTRLSHTLTMPLQESPEAYFENNVKPHVPDAWIDKNKLAIGYEINFRSYFAKKETTRSLHEIDTELKEAGKELMRLLGRVF